MDGAPAQRPGPFFFETCCETGPGLVGTLIQGSSCRSAWSSASPTLTAPLSPPPTWPDCRLAVFWSSEAPPPGTADRRGCAAPWSRPKLSVSDFPRVPASPSHGVFPTQRLRPRAEAGGNRRCGGRNAPDAEWLPSRSQGADRWVDAGYPLGGWPRQGNRKKGSCPILDFWWLCQAKKAVVGSAPRGEYRLPRPRGRKLGLQRRPCAQN